MSAHPSSNPPAPSTNGAKKGRPGFFGALSNVLIGVLVTVAVLGGFFYTRLDAVNRQRLRVVAEASDTVESILRTAYGNVESFARDPNIRASELVERQPHLRLESEPSIRWHRTGDPTIIDSSVSGGLRLQIKGLQPLQRLPLVSRSPSEAQEGEPVRLEISAPPNPTAEHTASMVVRNVKVTLDARATLRPGRRPLSRARLAKSRIEVVSEDAEAYLRVTLPDDREIPVGLKNGPAVELKKSEASRIVFEGETLAVTHLEEKHRLDLPIEPGLNAGFDPTERLEIGEGCSLWLERGAEPLFALTAEQEAKLGDAAKEGLVSASRNMWGALLLSTEATTLKLGGLSPEQKRAWKTPSGDTEDSYSVEARPCLRSSANEKSEITLNREQQTRLMAWIEEKGVEPALVLVSARPGAQPAVRLEAWLDRARTSLADSSLTDAEREALEEAVAAGEVPFSTDGDQLRLLLAGSPEEGEGTVFRALADSGHPLPERTAAAFRELLSLTEAAPDDDPSTDRTTTSPKPAWTFLAVEDDDAFLIRAEWTGRQDFTFSLSSDEKKAIDKLEAEDRKAIANQVAKLPGLALLPRGETIDMVLSENGDASPSPTFRVDLASTIPRALREGFRGALIADHDARVVAQWWSTENPSELRIDSLSSLEARPPKEGDTPPIAPAPANTPTVTSSYSGRLAGARTNIVCQPVRLPDIPDKLLPAIDSDDRPEHRKVDFADNAWQICAVSNRADELRSALDAAPLVSAGLGLLALFLFLGLPLIKFVALDPHDRFRKRDLVLVLVAGFWLLAVITVLVSAFGEWVTLREELDERLERLAHAVETRLDGELRTLYELLDDLDRAVCAQRGKLPDGSGGNPPLLVSEILEPPDKRSPTAERGILERPNAPSPAPDVGLVLHLDGPKGELVRSAAWIDRDGQQFVKATVYPRNTPAVRVAHREYFRGVRQERAWCLEGDSDSAWSCPPPEDGTVVAEPRKPIILDAFFSATTGQRSAALSMESCLSKEIEGHGPIVAVLETQPATVTAPLVSPPFGFAVIDRAGRTLFHSDPDLANSESLIAHVEGVSRLKSVLDSGGEQKLNLDYVTRAHRMMIRPLGSSPLSVIAFYDRQFTHTVLLDAAAMGLAWAAAYFVILVLLVVAFRRVVMDLYWPLNPDNSRYKLVFRVCAVLSVALIVLLVVPRFLFSPLKLEDELYLVLGVLFPIAGFLVTLLSLLLENIRGDKERRRAALRWEIGALALLYLIPAALVFVLPLALLWLLSSGHPVLVPAALPFALAPELLISIVWGLSSGVDPVLVAAAIPLALAAGALIAIVLVQLDRGLKEALLESARKGAKRIHLCAQFEAVKDTGGRLTQWLRRDRNSRAGPQTARRRPHLRALFALFVLIGVVAPWAMFRSAWGHQLGVLLRHEVDTRRQLEAAREVALRRESNWIEPPRRADEIFRQRRDSGDADRYWLTPFYAVLDEGTASLIRGPGLGWVGQKLWVYNSTAQKLRFVEPGQALEPREVAVSPDLRPARGLRTNDLMLTALLIALGWFALWVLWRATRRFGGHVYFFRAFDNKTATPDAAAADARDRPIIAICPEAAAFDRLAGALGFRRFDLADPTHSPSHSRLPIVLSGFQEGLDDDANRKWKLETLEGLLDRQRLVLLVVPRHPLDLLDDHIELHTEDPSGERERWSRLLARFSFRVVPVPSPEKLDRDGVDNGEAFYWAIWTSCSREEKLSLLQLAQEKVLNPKQHPQVQALREKGLLTEPPDLRIRDGKFHAYLGELERRHRLASGWEEKLSSGGWQQLRWILGATLLAVVALLFVVERQAFDSILGFLAAAAAGLPLLFRLTRLSGSGGD